MTEEQKCWSVDELEARLQAGEAVEKSDRVSWAHPKGRYTTDMSVRSYLRERKLLGPDWPKHYW